MTNGFKGFFHSHRGKPSMMALGFFVGLFFSAACIVVGLSLCVYEVVVEAGSNRTNVGMPLVALGMGAFTGGALAKAWQGSAEARADAVAPPAPPSAPPAAPLPPPVGR